GFGVGPLDVFFDVVPVIPLDFDVVVVPALDVVAGADDAPGAADVVAPGDPDAVVRSTVPFSFPHAARRVSIATATTSVFFITSCPPSCGGARTVSLMRGIVRTCTYPPDVKVRTEACCQSCGARMPRWVGRCPECSEWG